MEEAKILLMTEGDYPEIIQLWQNSPGIGLSDADSQFNISKFLKQNPGLSYISRVDGVLAGAVLCGTDGRRGYLYHLAVSITYRRLGIGKKLVEKVLNVLRERNIEKCHIFVIANNKEGEKFWKNISWQKRNDIFVMSYDLSRQ